MVQIVGAIADSHKIYFYFLVDKTKFIKLAESENARDSDLSEISFTLSGINRIHLSKLDMGEVAVPK